MMIMKKEKKTEKKAKMNKKEEITTPMTSTIIFKNMRSSRRTC